MINSIINNVAKNPTISGIANNLMGIAQNSNVGQSVKEHTDKVIQEGEKLRLEQSGVEPIENEPKVEEDGNTSLSEYEKLQNKIWEREDAIRKETQEREDTAYQRAVEDMRKAGINPNLIGIQPANSGGGITTATNVSGTATDEINMKIAELNNEIKKGTATESNVTSIIGDIIGLVSNAILAIAVKKK